MYLEVDGHRRVVPGDYARRLEGDGVELLGRGTAVVNTGGEKVYPAEVEAADPGPPGRGATAWSSACRTSAGARSWPRSSHPARARTLTAEQVDAHLTGRLAGYKMPRRIVVRTGSTGP